MKKSLFFVALSSLALNANAQSQALDIHFDDVASLPAGYHVYHGSQPAGQGFWTIGYPAGISGLEPIYAYGTNAASSSADSAAFLCNSFASVTGAGTINDWFLLPSFPVNNGDSLSFWTRTTPATDGTIYPDRLQVVAALGATLNVDTVGTGLGDFTISLYDINAQYSETDYPVTWTKYTTTLSGVPAANDTMSIAFRYFVEDGGVSGSRSAAIGIDEVSFRPATNVSVSHIAQPIAITAYPSPATSEVTVDFGKALTETSICSLINSNGQVMGTTQFQAGASAHRLNISNLATGVYIVRLVQGSEVFQTTFVKQ